MTPNPFFIILLLQVLPLTFSKPCPGECLDSVATCKFRGGKVVGYCVDEQPCCDFTALQTGSCGANKSGMTSAVFQSPNYPNLLEGPLNCEFNFDLPKFAKYDGVAIEFIDFITDGPGFVPHSPCEADMIFIRGFSTNWQPPPRCGNLTGYVALIDKSITSFTMRMKRVTILALMSSNTYKWKIKVRLIRGNGKASKMTDSKNPTTTEISNEENLDNEDNFRLLSPFVVNGEDADITDVPWQASLRAVFPKPSETNSSENETKPATTCTDEGYHFCGASIVSDFHLLSAAHCFYSVSKLQNWKSLDFVKVFLGETDLCKDDLIKYGRKSQIHSIEKIIFHYAYDDINMAINDVVILKLKDRIQFDKHIKAIALSKRQRSYSGKKVKVSGWGLTNLTTKVHKLPDILQSADGLIVENKTYCHSHLTKGFGAGKEVINTFAKYYNSFDSVLCTSSKNDTKSKLVGQGDSGGCLLHIDNSQVPPTPIQIGIVSYGLPALEATGEHENVFVDYYQDVSYYRNWIDLATLV